MQETGDILKELEEAKEVEVGEIIDYWASIGIDHVLTIICC